MTTWLTKFRISSALDDRKPLPPVVERAVSHSEELCRFARTATELDQVLKISRPEPESSASLHASIMHAVRSSEPVSNFDWARIWPRLIPVSTLALLILLGVFAASRWFDDPAKISKPGGSPSLAVVSDTLETGDTLVRAMPVAAVSPLTDEMLRLNHDLTNAQNFLLASLP